MNNRPIMSLPIQNVLVRERYVFSNIQFDGHLEVGNGVSFSSYNEKKNEPFGDSQPLAELAKIDLPNCNSLMTSLDDGNRTITESDPNQWLPVEKHLKLYRELKKAILTAALAIDINPFLAWRGIDLPSIVGDGVHLDERMAYSMNDSYYYYGQLGLVSKNYNRKSLDPHILHAYYQLISRLSNSHFDVFELVTSRLRAAEHMRIGTDRAFNVGLAAEIIFLHGEKGTGAKGELRYKVSNRAAWYLGKNSVERKQIANIVRKGYDARSAAVHTGSIKKAHRKAVAEMRGICGSALDKVLTDGCFPKDWNEIVF